MKLSKVESGHAFFQKLKLGVMRLQVGERVPDVVRLLMYRPELFGKQANHYFQRLLRGPSEWTVGERELMAAYVSQANDCRFCYGMHRAVADRALGSELVDAVFTSVETAPISAPLRATLGFIRKLTLSPTSVSAADAEAVRSTGVSKSALELAVHICACFCIINRLANSLGFEVPSLSAIDRGAQILLKYGYEL